jgi:hypothetical protein
MRVLGRLASGVLWVFAAIFVLALLEKCGGR